MRKLAARNRLDGLKVKSLMAEGRKYARIDHRLFDYNGVVLRGRGHDGDRACARANDRRGRGGSRDWSLEVVNVLVMAERRNASPPPTQPPSSTCFLPLDIQTDPETATRAFDHLPPLCRGHRLSSYDAAYLDLALRRRLPLASLDDDLRQAGPEQSLGIQVLGK